MAKKKMFLPDYERKNMIRGLNRLGFSSYPNYLRSGLWETSRRRLARTSCENCGSTTAALVLHHMTYGSLGAERAQDVCTLCVSCHKFVHIAAMRGGTLYPEDVMAARAGQPAREKRISALEVSCPLCGAMQTHHCRLPSGAVRPKEHKERRQAADRKARKKAPARRRKAQKKSAYTRRMSERQAQVIDRARDSEFPLEALNAELDDQMNQALRRD